MATAITTDNVITLKIGPIEWPIGRACWVAVFSGPHAEEVRQACGTTTIPTAFTDGAPASTVLAAIAKRNPGCTVRLA